MLIVIKGAGDLASGIAYRLKKSGFDVVMTEIENPTTVRRTVAFSQAIFDNETIIEGIKGIKVNSIDEINEVISQGNIPVMIEALFQVDRRQAALSALYQPRQLQSVRRRR